MFPPRLFPLRMFPQRAFPPSNETDLYVTHAQLTCLRAAAARSLPDIGDILGLVLYSDGRGGHTKDWPILLRALCRVQRLKEPVEVPVADKVTTSCGFKAWFPWGLPVDLSGEKRLVVLGVTYEIIGGVRNTSEELFSVAFCNRVEASSAGSGGSSSSGSSSSYLFNQVHGELLEAL